jgi:hypothetical protein
MESNEKQFVGSRVLLWVVIMLLPAIAGIVCIIYSTVALDRGLFWTLATLAAIPAFLGLIAAIVTAIVTSIRRRLTGGIMISTWIIIAIIGTAWWYSVYFIRNPFAP